VNQYGPGALYAYVETNSTTVTFTAGLHVGAEVKFTTSSLNSSAGGDAFQVSYTPPFLSSATTNVGNKLAQTVSLQDFGAVGDGVTDDTAAIQAAINACANSSLYVVGGGTYLHTGLNLIAPISIIGDGRTTLKTTGTRCFELTGSTIDGLILDNLLLENAGTAGGGSDLAAGIFGTSCTITNSRITNNDLNGFGVGISLSGGANPITYNDAYGGTYTTQGKDGRNIVAFNRIYDTLAPTRIGTGGGSSIFTQDSGYWEIIGNRCENMQGGILSPTYGVVSNNVIINIFDDNGIYSSGSVNVAITGNYIEKTFGDGVALNDTQFCTISGNVISAPGNSGIRLQEGNDIQITGNLIRGGANTGAYMRGFIDAGSPNAPYNISIVGNTFTGGTSNVTNPFAFGSVPIGTPYKNWKFAENKVDLVNTSSLTSLFFGPYRIIQFGSIGTASNVIVANNLFTDVTECPLNAQGNYQYITATQEYGNQINHAAGYVTVPNVGSIILSGSTRFACGSLGVVLSDSYRGFVTSVVKGANTGEYTVTFDRAYEIHNFSWSSSGANAPFTVRMNVISPTINDDWVSSCTVIFYDAAGAAIWPNFNSSNVLNFTATGGGIGVQ
jgi:parallel beta-helix repeat protein